MKAFFQFRLSTVLLMPVLFALLPIATSGQSWYSSTWSYRKAITIDFTKVGAGPHTNFPVLINITDANLQTLAQSTGNDILFTSADGTTKISHEIENYASGTGALVAWVQIPVLSSSANTVIYMYYGNASAASQQNRTGTWDATFKGVYHLNNAYNDATSNSFNGVNTGVTAVAGKMSLGGGFTRSNGTDYIAISGLMGSPANVTLSSWSTLTTRDNAGAEIIGVGDYIGLDNGDPGLGGIGFTYAGGSTWNRTSSNIQYGGTGWHYFSYTFNNVGKVQVLYVDGVQVAATAFTAPINYAGLGANTFIGAHANGSTDFDFDGSLDEVRVAGKLGNFFVFFIKTLTRVMIPICIIIAVILAFNGTPASFEGKDSFVSLQGDTVHVSRGPAAGMIAIKHLGTNGGGWFGANSTHPLENPNYFTNAVEVIAQVILPMALVFAFGFFIRRRKLGYVIFGVMTAGMLSFMIPNLVSELSGNPAIANMHLANSSAMEGKEVRFGVAASAYWQIMTTVISTGSVNSMHDSSMPMSGAMQLLGMMTNCFYGGKGVGLLNYFIFLIIAVFISGLMVGRTPEFMGRKVEAREMKIASIIALLHPLLVLAGTALSAYIVSHHPATAWAVQPANWANNPGNHGFSEMLYEYTSASANNGSGFEGLADSNIFWNLSTGFVMILGRFLPIIGPVAIAGMLAAKKFVPDSAGTLQTDTVTFGVMTYAVIIILAALAFFPALTLGPIAEYFNL